MILAGHTAALVSVRAGIDRLVDEAKRERRRSHDLARTTEVKNPGHMIDAAAFFVRQKALEDARAIVEKVMKHDSEMAGMDEGAASIKEAGPGPAAGRMTFGQYLVGKDFNPSGNPTVDDLKAKAAAFIDAVQALDVPDYVHDVRRLKALAVDRAEEAAMWAVKAATKKQWAG